MYEKYIDELSATLKNVEVDEIRTAEDLIISIYRNNKRIYVIGNGGSAAASSHWVCDFGKIIVMDKKRFQVMSLTDNNAWITAIANDLSYEDVFVEQLRNLMSEGDLLIGISASGNSENIVRSFEYAHSIGAKTMGIIGFFGGKVRELSDHSIYIPSYNYGIVEDIQLAIGHMISQEIKSNMKDGRYDG
ncbi:MAG: SIS domain-containing protein [Firmicutes bacterium]|nr:SIS domain-containing protein [Bacillota bacterium]